MKDLIKVKNHIRSGMLEHDNILKIADFTFSCLKEKHKEIRYILIDIFGNKEEILVIADSKGAKLLDRGILSFTDKSLGRRIIKTIKTEGFFYERSIFPDSYIYDNKNKTSYKHSLIVFPIKIDKNIRGLLRVFVDSDKDVPEEITDYFRDVTNTVSEILGNYPVLVKTKKLQDFFETGLLNIIDLLVSLIELRDRYTSGHSNNVKTISILISENMGLGKKDIDDISCAANLHDIGKIAISEKILNKPAKLTDSEFEEIKRHPVQGAFLLANIPQLKKISKLILHHHERYDGGGYPSGLSGIEIPLGSRIISVADAYDAMISKRSYRDNLDDDLVIEIMKKEAGYQFDSEIISEFIKILSRIPKRRSSSL